MPALTKVSTGINTKTFAPFFYVEARLNPKDKWALLTDGKRWLRHRTKAAADKAAAKLEKRLCVNLSKQEAA